eukprot:1955361-Rhodomonas_salina.2
MRALGGACCQDRALTACASLLQGQGARLADSGPGGQGYERGCSGEGSRAHRRRDRRVRGRVGPAASAARSGREARDARRAAAQAARVAYSASPDPDPAAHIAGQHAEQATERQRHRSAHHTRHAPPAVVEPGQRSGVRGRLRSAA